MPEWNLHYYYPLTLSHAWRGKFGGMSTIIMQEMRKLIKTPLKHRPCPAQHSRMFYQHQQFESSTNCYVFQGLTTWSLTRLTFLYIWISSICCLDISSNWLTQKICMFTCPLFETNTVSGKGDCSFSDFSAICHIMTTLTLEAKRKWGRITVSFRQGSSTRCLSWEQFRRKNRIHRPPFPPIIRSIIKTEFLEQEWKIGFEHYRRICIELVLKTFCKNENGVWTLPPHWPHERSDGIPFCKVVATIVEAIGTCTNNAINQIETKIFIRWILIFKTNNGFMDLCFVFRISQLRYDDLREDINEKKRFLSGIAGMRGGGTMGQNH